MQSLLRVVILGAPLLLASTAMAAQAQRLSGKKLLIKNPPSGAAGNKIVHLSKDTSIVPGAANSFLDPRCTAPNGGGTSSLRIIASGGAGAVTIPLPCTGWTRTGFLPGDSMYKYTDTSGATCNIVIVKGARLAKAVCKGPQVAIDVSGSMSPVAVVLNLNADVFCTEFGGTLKKDGSDDKTFLRKDAPAPFACPTTTTTIPPGSTCCALASDVCFNNEDQNDVDVCTGSGGTPQSGVCDGATGTCQVSNTGESACCRDAGAFPCSEGPGVSSSTCTSLGGVYALDSCADGCIPGTSTTSSTSTTSTTTSTTSTSSTSSTSSSTTSTSTSSTTTTSNPPCTVQLADCTITGVCNGFCSLTNCGSGSCTMECVNPDITPGSCTTDADCPLVGGQPVYVCACGGAPCGSGGFCRLRCPSP